MMQGLYTLGLVLVGLLLWDVCVLRRRHQCSSIVEFCPFDKQATMPLRGILALSVVIGHLASRVPGAREFLSFVYFPTEAVAIFFLCRDTACQSNG